MAKVYDCMHCGSHSVVWEADFNMDEYDPACEEGGVVHIGRCSNCGAEVTCIIRDEGSGWEVPDKIAQVDEEFRKLGYTEKVVNSSNIRYSGDICGCGEPAYCEVVIDAHSGFVYFFYEGDCSGASPEELALAVKALDAYGLPKKEESEV